MKGSHVLKDNLLISLLKATLHITSVYIPQEEKGRKVDAYTFRMW